MQRIKINAKEGFYTDGPVNVYDKRGLFLNYGKPTYFNLPAGEYTVSNGSISALEEPVYYEPLDLAMPTKPPLSRAINIKPRYSRETNKMDIDYKTGDMRINPDWEKTLTTPDYEFATRHESGHYFYDASDQGQYNCDRMAADSMLEDGFNPDQIRKASHATLCGQCAPKRVVGDRAMGFEVFQEQGLPYQSAQRRYSLEQEMLEISQAAADRIHGQFEPFGYLTMDPMDQDYKSRNVWEQIFYGDFGK